MSEKNENTLQLLLDEVSMISGIAAIDPDLELQDLRIDSMKLVAALINYFQIFTDAIDVDRLAIDEHTTLRNLDRKVQAEVAKARGVPAMAEG